MLSVFVLVVCFENVTNANFHYNLVKSTFTQVNDILKHKTGQKVSDLHFSGGETLCLLCAAFHKLVFDKTSLPLLSNKTTRGLNCFRLPFHSVKVAYTAAMVSRLLNNNLSSAIQL